MWATAADDELRALGCMGVASVSEFGAAAPNLVALWSITASTVSKRIAERVEEGQVHRALDLHIPPEDASAFVQVMMAGPQIAARSVADLKTLRRMVSFGAG